MILRKKAFYNFTIAKRYLVAKDIICKYWIPLPQVIALFSPIYPQAYFKLLEDTFGNQSSSIDGFRHLKRIKIYTYFKPQKVVKNGKTESVVAEDQQLLESIASKKDFSSKEMIIEYTNRFNEGKDPWYRATVAEPYKQLSADELNAIQEFVSFWVT